MSGPRSTIELAVLGTLRVRVGGADVTDRLTPSQAAIVALLAAAPSPLAKSDICRAVVLSPSSIDSQLSRLNHTLELDRAIHRARTPRAGFIALDPHVRADVAEFRTLVAEATAAPSPEPQRAGVLSTLVAADELWRGPVFADLVLVDDGDAMVRPSAVAAMLDEERRRCRDAAVRRWLEDPRLELDADRLRRWAEEMIDSHICWFAAIKAALEHQGVSSATDLLDRWKERAAITDDVASTNLFGVAARLVGGPGGPSPPAGERAALATARGDYDDAVAIYDGEVERAPVPARPALLLARAEARYLRGEWDAAHRELPGLCRRGLRAGGRRVRGGGTVDAGPPHVGPTTVRRGASRAPHADAG